MVLPTLCPLLYHSTCLLTLIQDAAAAALFTACKIEDTLKRSREIVCAAYNLKLPAQEHMAPDNPVSCCF